MAASDNLPGGADAVAAPMRSVDHLCPRCGYNLRGLPRDRRCPECGSANAGGGSIYQLQRADPAWVRWIAHGMVLFVIGAAVRVAWVVWWGLERREQAGLALGAIVLETLGMWLFTTASPGVWPYDGGWFRRPLRIAAVVVFLAEGYRVTAPWLGVLGMPGPIVSERWLFIVVGALAVLRTMILACLMTSITYMMPYETLGDWIVIVALGLVGLPLPVLVSWAIDFPLFICFAAMFLPPFVLIYVVGFYPLIRFTVDLYRCARVSKRLV